MIFSSLIFILYFLPVFFFIYYSLKNKYKNLFILIASILFYSWGAPKFIFVIIATTLFDFFIVGQMAKIENVLKRKILLSLSIFVNVGLLFYFKYANFFIDNVNFLLSSVNLPLLPVLKVVLPIGISFYTFESITYVVDVYRKIHKPLSNFWEYQLYIILFPKLIAGPIVRYHDIADQINNRFATDNAQRRLHGFYRFALGLSKKVLIANPLARHADLIFSLNYQNTAGADLWVGILSYTFQIYFDFSGYSDMAIGLCKMMGFAIPENFDNPYTAKSITEFWRRWHISLGNWMKNYLYIPLGGNRSSSAQVHRNLCIVFIISGFWHGASWAFIIWGLVHGLFLVIERAGFSKILDKLPTLFSRIYTFAIVMFAWVLFRSESLSSAARFVKYACSNIAMNSDKINNSVIFYLVLAGFFSFFVCFKITDNFHKYIYYTEEFGKKNVILSFFSLLLLFLCICMISNNSYNPFIYFRF